MNQTEGIRETTIEELEKLGIEKKIKELEIELERIANITKELSIIPKEILLLYFLGFANQLIKQAIEKIIEQQKYSKM